jgi:hypothetical protein
MAFNNQRALTQEVLLKKLLVFIRVCCNQNRTILEPGSSPTPHILLLGKHLLDVREGREGSGAF